VFGSAGEFGFAAGFSHGAGYQIWLRGRSIAGMVLSHLSRLASHLEGLGSHAMRGSGLRFRLWCNLRVTRFTPLLLLLACTNSSNLPNAPLPLPTVISIPDLKPIPETPVPVQPVDGILEFGTGERVTLRVLAFYDANSNNRRDNAEVVLESAGLRLTPVKLGDFGPEKIGPARVVRASKEGLLIARVPVGVYSLEFVKITVAGTDPNAAQWATAERVLGLSQDASLELPAFCQIEARTQASPIGVCVPQYDLRPRASLAAVPEDIEVGGIAKLRFRADDDAVVTLEPFGQVESFIEIDFWERFVQPKGTTTYTLRAKNAYGTREVKATVTVQP
jgi:hypothetical protein